MNQTPEQIARDQIDKLLENAGWQVQHKSKINLNACKGIAIQEYPTSVGPADYALFVNGKPVGVIEAKRAEEGHHLTMVEEQSAGYAKAKLKWVDHEEPLPFVYESTGEVTRFTNFHDPKPASRPVFSFHKPETLEGWLKEDSTLRRRLQLVPPLGGVGAGKTDDEVESIASELRLRTCQFQAVANLEHSFAHNRPRALIQMATGAGKTYTAITFIYRLLKYAKAKRVLFLVDTKNLGEQAEQEFMAYTPIDDNFKFTELYPVQRLKSSYIPSNSIVCISTIQRLYSILKGEELDEAAEEQNPDEMSSLIKQPVPVAYSEKLPIEFFDFIVIDESHRSIYNLWKQVLDYFDASLIGLTATPDKRTFAFFNENVVSEYDYQKAVADGILVPYNEYRIETHITKHGAEIKAGETVDTREKLTRRERWTKLEDEIKYTGKQLDRDIVNPSTIRHIIRTYRDKVKTEIFPGREEVPKTLIFAKSDSHADDIIQMVREEFGEGNDFCRKITYKEEDPRGVLTAFRSNYYPRIAVTVDMVATGTDIRPLECLLFMRDVKSRTYYEQMLGRGTRTCSQDDMLKVDGKTTSAKTHFVVVDAIGVTQTVKVDTRPLEKKPGVPMKDLLQAVMMGSGRTEEHMTSLANRLARLEKQVTPQEKEKFEELAGGKSINRVIGELLNAFNPDVVEAVAHQPVEQGGTEGDSAAAQEKLVQQAAATFTGELNEYIDNVRRVHEQIVDKLNLDEVTFAGWNEQAQEKAEALVQDFKAFLEEHRDEITALRIFYNQPYRRREVNYKMMREVLDLIKQQRPTLAPASVWQAYQQLDKLKGQAPKNELVALVALLRRVLEIDQVLTPYSDTVNRNFKEWLFKKQAGQLKFTEEQMDWLRLMKDHISTSIHLDREDLDYAPFDAQGGLGRMYQLFGAEWDKIIEELNEELAA